MPFITSGEAMAGEYNISTPGNGTSFSLWSESQATLGSQNNFNVAGLYKTSSTNLHYYSHRYRVIWVKNGTPVAGGNNASWYKIISMSEYGDTFWDSGTSTWSKRKACLVPCYAVDTYNSNTATNMQLTFQRNTNDNDECCLWAFFQRPSGRYCIVSYESWKNKGTTSFTGNVRWLVAQNHNIDYAKKLTLEKWDTISSNSWADTFASWTLDRRIDCQIKVNGHWRTVSQPWIKINGTWRKIIRIQVKENKYWEKVDENGIVIYAH